MRVMISSCAIFVNYRDGSGARSLLEVVEIRGLCFGEKP